MYDDNAQEALSLTRVLKVIASALWVLSLLGAVLLLDWLHGAESCGTSSGCIPMFSSAITFGWPLGVGVGGFLLGLVVLWFAYSLEMQTHTYLSVRHLPSSAISEVASTPDLSAM
jgi:hypothetical protein